MKYTSAALRSSLWVAIFGLFLVSFYYAGHSFTKARVPQSGHSAELYSTQTHDDLQLAFSQAIYGAKKSVLCSVYSLKDTKIIQALRDLAEQDVDVQVLCDARASQGVDRKLGPKVKTTLRRGKGIMHQKILVVDEKKVWIGSANMTTASLRWHSNLVTGFHSPKLAANIKDKLESMTKEGMVYPVTTRNFSIGGQKVEIWFLPDNKNGTARIVQLIRTAKKAIRVAMFTWTRMDFADEIIKALDRGVDVQVAVDSQSASGVSAKVVEHLSSAGVPVHLSQGDALLHYKFMVVDNRILVNGSANWTLAAFALNDDCFIILNKLRKPQIRFLKDLWEVIKAETTPLER